MTWLDTMKARTTQSLFIVKNIPYQFRRQIQFKRVAGLVLKENTKYNTIRIPKNNVLYGCKPVKKDTKN